MLAVAGCKNTEPAQPEASPVAAAPPVAPPPGVQSLAERGAYLVKAANCAICHTAIGPNGRPDVEHVFAGGLEVKEPFGTWRGTNITPDPRTGIGAWTDAQIAAAIREGVRPDGSHLFSIMPYTMFNRLTDSDVKAIVAFLRSVPPVERAVPRMTEFAMPKVEVPRPSNAPDRVGDPVEHGKYLASVMQCAHCHATPGKDMGPPEPDKLFSGGVPMEFPPGSGQVYARNLTSDRETGLGTWTEDQVFTVLKTMTKPDGTAIRGPMLLLQAGWSQLDDKDLRAVAAFIKSLPPVTNKVPAAAAPPAGGSKGT